MKKLYYDNSKDLYEGLIIEDEYGIQRQVGEIFPAFRNDYGILFVTAVNACLKVNSDNPMAVAQSIGDMYESLKAFQFAAAVENPYSKDKEIYEQANKALAKADGIDKTI